MSDYRHSHQPEERAVAYEEDIYAAGTFDSWMWRLEQQVLPELVDRYCTPPIRYLDFACGTGRIISLLESRAERATGVDISAAMLEFARTKVVKATLVEGDITGDPSLLQGPYDLITAFRFFVNAQPELRDQVLGALVGALAPGGVLITNIHANKWSLRIITSTVRRVILRQRLPQLSLGDLTALLRRHGLEIVETRGLGLVNSSLYLVLGERLSSRLERLAARWPPLQRVALNLIVVCRPSR